MPLVFSLSLRHFEVEQVKNYKKNQANKDEKATKGQYSQIPKYNMVCRFHKSRTEAW